MCGWNALPDFKRRMAHHKFALCQHALHEQTTNYMNYARLVIKTLKHFYAPNIIGNVKKAKFVFEWTTGHVGRECDKY